MIDETAKARIIRRLYNKKKIFGLSKPEKILFDNPNIPHAFGNEDIGSMRECFFASQISRGHSLFMPQKGDFFVDDRYTFEVSGRNKKYTQIKDIENSFKASDDIEIGALSKIPLWLFGFLY